jgi:hypothetical protein
MSDIFMLSKKQFNRLKSYFPLSPGMPRVTADRLMIDATPLKAHRTAASLLKKGGVPRRIGRTKGGLNSKLHAVCNGEGKPVAMLLSEGQMSDYKGAALLLPACQGKKVGIQQEAQRPKLYF